MTELEQKKKFEQLMFQLDVYYVNFKFFNDEDKDKKRLKLQVWFKALSVIPFDRLEYVVNDYCVKNVYPPSSPTSLIEHYRSIILNYYSPAEIEFEKFVERVKTNGYDLERHIKAYAKYPHIQETLRRLKSDFEMWRLDSSRLTYFKHNFIEHYNKVIQNQVNEEKLKLGE